MNIPAFIARLKDEYYGWGTICAYPKVAAPYVDVLDDIQAMTTPSTMHLLNLAAQHLEGDELYLEVGTWRGGTLIGALLGNQARGIAIDNDVMDDHDKDERASSTVWRENVAKFGVAKRARYIGATWPVALTPAPLVGVYLFDGDKSTVEAAYAGLVGIVPYLAPRAMIFVDDANQIEIRRAVYEFGRAYPQANTVMDIPTPANCWPAFWNGMIAMLWVRE